MISHGVFLTLTCLIPKSMTKVRNNKGQFQPSHGLSYKFPKLIAIWRSIKFRCLNPKCKAYKYYGESGITICNEWLNPNSFIEWCIISGYKEGLEIDRIDNTKGYSPTNCRFISTSENCKNRRSTKLNWDKVREIRSMKETHSISQLAKIYSVTVQSIHHVINNKQWKESLA